METADKSGRLARVQRDTRPVANSTCIPAPSTRASNVCENGPWNTPIDALRTTSTNHEHGCLLKLVENKSSATQCRMRSMAYGKQTEHQMARQSKLSACFAVIRHTPQCTQPHGVLRLERLDRHSVISGAFGASCDFLPTELSGKSFRTRYWRCAATLSTFVEKHLWP